MLAAFFGTAGVASWVTFQMEANADAEDPGYKFTFGFIFASIAAATQISSFAAACYIRKSDDYEYMA